MKNVAKIYKIYSERCLKANAMDFDDLLYYTYKLFKNELICQKYANFFKYILVDEYQDTNMVLMAYNMGEDGAARLWEKGIYSTDYTEKILNYQTQFNEQLGGE